MISIEKATKIGFIQEEVIKNYYETIAILKKQKKRWKRKKIKTHLEKMRNKFKKNYKIYYNNNYY